MPGSLAAWEAALVGGAEALGLELAAAEVARLREHFALVRAENARAGLTALREPVEVARKHYLDSLTCLLVHDVPAGEGVVDVGPGGGFPGLVLAIVRPAARYVLVESSAKRAAFLELAARELGLSQVVVVPGRAEAVGRSADHRERYDLAVSRAVASLPVLLEYLLPLVRIGGQALAMKGPEAGAEIAAGAGALQALGGRIGGVKELSLPEGAGARALVLIDKPEPTPARYPRRPGIPAKRPL